jgi:hypothetical protein
MVYGRGKKGQPSYRGLYAGNKQEWMRQKGTRDQYLKSYGQRQEILGSKEIYKCNNKIHFHKDSQNTNHKVCFLKIKVSSSGA